ncbi:MAG: hypothetical protein NTY03_05100, partial [Candidatus Bathyarchaeota archaeon]|nr:hypothetical protein [Candidatus Bathyarchaeota archaeon]
DYDNSEFINYLVDRGFFVADGSRTRNYSTQRALCSYLNMEWLSEAETDSIVYQKIENNRVVSFLRTYDYKVVFFGNPFSTNRYKFDADVSYDFYTNGSSALVSEFPRILWNTTMFRPFYDYLTQNQFQSTLRRGLLDTLEHLKEMPHMEGPKFVFAHIDCPHEPFVFGPEGEDVSFMNYTNFEDKQFYLGQYIFIRREIAKVVEVLLGESSDPPVIVIQSDHGIRAAIVPGNERWKIFNAYFMPADGGDMLYDTISPVNSFRVIFNQYFNADYPLLED